MIEIIETEKKFVPLCPLKRIKRLLETRGYEQYGRSHKQINTYYTHHNTFDIAEFNRCFDLDIPEDIKNLTIRTRDYFEGGEVSTRKITKKELIVKYNWDNEGENIMHHDQRKEITKPVSIKTKLELPIESKWYRVCRVSMMKEYKGEKIHFHLDDNAGFGELVECEILTDKIKAPTIGLISEAVTDLPIVEINPLLIKHMYHYYVLNWRRIFNEAWHFDQSLSIFQETGWKKYISNEIFNSIHPDNTTTKVCLG